MSEWYNCERCGTTRENLSACDNPDCPDYIRQNIAIISTGNAEQDEAELRRSTLHEDRLDKGQCPNGDGGKLHEESPGTWVCPICKFTLFRRTLL